MPSGARLEVNMLNVGSAGPLLQLDVYALTRFAEVRTLRRLDDLAILGQIFLPVILTMLQMQGLGVSSKFILTWPEQL